MNRTQSIVKFIEQYEGYRKYINEDTKGLRTIGIGFNLDAGCSRELAVLIAEYFIGKAVTDLEDIFGEELFNSLDKPRRFVLIDMMFNMGKRDFMGFKKMIKAVKQKRFGDAAVEIIDSLYFEQVKQRAKRNVRIMDTGQFQIGSIK